MDYVELAGYIASILVAISLTMSKIVRLRIINLIGSVFFAIYGFLVGAYPVLVVNTFIVLINIYYLVKLFKNKDLFDVLNAQDNLEYFERFILHYKDDIVKFFPDFSDELIQDSRSLFVLRNMRPVNLVIFKEQGNGITEILIDYTIPEYRDFLNGKYILSLFTDSGSSNKQLVVKSNSKDHIKYLNRLGFIKNDAGLFVKRI
ncbi:MAG: YgjV family protein [Spirochaetales bacterium]|nr:YgjV family protein [Spirochaetales bacterium]